MFVLCGPCCCGCSRRCSVLNSETGTACFFCALLTRSMGSPLTTPKLSSSCASRLAEKHLCIFCVCVNATAKQVKHTQQQQQQQERGTVLNVSTDICDDTGGKWKYSVRVIWVTVGRLTFPTTTAPHIGLHDKGDSGIIPFTIHIQIQSSFHSAEA